MALVWLGFVGKQEALNSVRGVFCRLWLETGTDLEVGTIHRMVQPDGEIEQEISPASIKKTPYYLLPFSPALNLVRMPQKDQN